ncbi:hypothetical protein PT276_07010 [Orbaceae bacterium ESL0721]|nr:hypothetical protein [Orbaceae bacterium ESL0721]
MAFLYFLVQTSWGAAILSQQLSKYSGYSISIGRVHHSILQLDQISLDNVIISKNQCVEPAFNASKLIIGLDKENPWQLQHLNYISIYNGVIKDLNFSQHLISANSVQFIDSTIFFHFNDEEIMLQNATGGVKPFSSKDDEYQFDLSAQTVLFNNLPFSSLLIQGYQRDGIISFTNVGGSFKSGFFVGRLNILADNSLDFSQLQINKLNFQSAVEHDELSDFFSMLPKMRIRRFSLIDSSFLSPYFAVEKGNIEASNLEYDNGWRLGQSSLVFNAENLRWHNHRFTSPLIQLKRDGDKIMIEKGLAVWNEGNINFTGSWQNDAVQLDNLIMAGANYEYEFSPTPLPALLKEISINNLMILPSTILATYPNYPFRFTNFEISGNNLTVAKNNQLGLYSGSFYVKAEDGTFQGVNIKYPDLTVKILAENLGEFNFSTLLDQGVLESSAVLDLTVPHFSALKLNGYNVDSAILKQWQLVKNPPSTNNFSANLTGKLAAFDLSGNMFANSISYAIVPQH